MEPSLVEYDALMRLCELVKMTPALQIPPVVYYSTRATLLVITITCPAQYVSK